MGKSGRDLKIDNLPHSMIGVESEFGKRDRNAYLTLKETAAFLGLSQETIYTYSSKGKIPSIKKKGRLCFLKSDLTNLTMFRQGKSLAEIAIENDKLLYNKKG